MNERNKLLLMVGLFAGAWFVPAESPAVAAAIVESLAMLREYAREHVLACLIPAFFIAGAIGVFLAQDSVMRYLGSRAKRVVAYGVAAVSGAVLAVCSCTILPLFAGIYKRGAGLGPACAFLYAGPAVNVLAIVLTARVLGLELGLARAIGAVVFSVVIGLAMAFLFRREESDRNAGADPFAGGDDHASRTGRTLIFFASLMALLIFAAWGRPKEPVGWAMAVYEVHWVVAGALLAAVLAMTFAWFRSDERREWLDQTWDFTKMILPLLFLGVIVAGLLLGRPGTDAGLIPASWVSGLVGDDVNPLLANFVASVAGALMYIATLTEVPILQGLMGQGMGKGPALALLLAGPALSLPNLLVIRSVLGTRKTLAYSALVVVMATVSGLLYGMV